MDLALRKAILAFGRRLDLPSEVPGYYGGDPRSYIAPEIFEAFSAHFILNHRRSFGFDRAEIVSLITGGFRDSKIDALALVMNGELILSEEDLAVFEENDPSSEVDVEFIFIQATLREYLSQGKIANFCTGISNFLGTESLLDEGEQIAYWRRLKEKILAFLEHRGCETSPRCTLYLAWPEQQSELPGDHHAILELRRRDLVNSAMFSAVDYEIVDGPKFLELVTRERISNVATLKCEGLLPVHAGDYGRGPIKASWLGYVKAKALLEAIQSADGALRPQLFYENVRHFLGEGKGTINEGIANTVRGAERSRFAMMNNGVTIVAHHAEVQKANQLILEDFQIVNGCQTSHTLHRNKAALDDTVMVPLKVVSTGDENVIHDIVVASNSQTKVDAMQLLSRDPYVRRVQQQFDSVWGFNRSRHIWFERRTGEHSGWRRTHGDRVVSIFDLIQGFASIFLERPHWVQNASHEALPQLARESIFTPKCDVALHYISALIIWRARRFMGTQKGGEWRYPAKHHLAFAIRLLAESESWRGADGYGNDKPALVQYLKSLRRTLWDDDEARRIAVEAHDLVVVSVKRLGRPFNSNAAKHQVLTDTVREAVRSHQSELVRQA